MTDQRQDGLIEFLWWVPENGFQPLLVTDNKDGKAKKERWLVPVREARRFYDPFTIEDAATLFMRFTDLQPEERPILLFANEYGPLVGKEVSGREGKVVLGADLFSLWQSEICALWQARRLWSVLCKKEEFPLDSLISIREKKNEVIVQYRGMRPKTRFTTQYSISVSKASGEGLGPEHTKEVVETTMADLLLGDGGLEIAGWLVLRRFMDARLKEHVGVNMIPLLEGPDIDNIKETSLSIRLVPRNLLGALWLQFGRAVDVHAEFRRCLACEMWLKIAKNESRSSRVTCSPCCRQKIQRQRKEKACLMHANGATVSKIVKETGSSKEVIKRWIKPRKPRGRPRKKNRK